MDTGISLDKLTHTLIPGGLVAVLGWYAFRPSIERHFDLISGTASIEVKFFIIVVVSIAIGNVVKSFSDIALIALTRGGVDQFEKSPHRRIARMYSWLFAPRTLQYKVTRYKWRIPLVEFRLPDLRHEVFDAVLAKDMDWLRQSIWEDFDATEVKHIPILLKKIEYRARLRSELFSSLIDREKRELTFLASLFLAQMGAFHLFLCSAVVYRNTTSFFLAGPNAPFVAITIWVCAIIVSYALRRAYRRYITHCISLALFGKSTIQAQVSPSL